MPEEAYASTADAATTPSLENRISAGSKEPNPLWVSFKAFMKVHWRITLAIFCTLGVVVMPFGGETAADRIGGTLAYLVGAIVFWTLHRRHVAPRTDTVDDARRSTVDRLDMSIEDGWARRLSNCREKATVFNEVATATQAGSVRKWLASMSDEIDAQLIQATDLAALGRSIEPGFDGTSPPVNSAAKEAWARLGEFESDLGDAVTRAAEVRLNSLSPASNLDSVREQLDMLQSQLPTLDPR
ncbi:hypothetical protein AYJ66_11120 [Dietzia cinnamea]|nr:hypothetical protein AYJ66_11120 [Dietzia cinnamea]